MNTSFLLLSVVIGFILGIFSGLVPGIHTNTFSFILAAFSPILDELGFSPVCVAAIIISNALTHTFLDIIPSVFLGAPDATHHWLCCPGTRCCWTGMV